MRLSDFERDGAAFVSALTREHFLQAAGLKPNLEISPIFDTYRWLFDPETFYDLRSVPLDEPLDEKYRRFLLAFVAAGLLENGVRQRTEAIASAEASKTIEWRGQELTYRAASVVWTNEPDADRRHELNEIWRAAVAELNPARAERHRAML